MRKGYSATTLVLACIVSFLAGSFLDAVPGLPEAGKGPTVHGSSPRTHLMETVPDEEQPAKLSVQTSMAPRSYEEALQLSGVLADRPPVGHGQGGQDHYTVAPFQVLSEYPRAYLFPKFLTEEQCDHIKGIAIKQMYPSGLAFKAGDTVENTKDVRTSSGTFLTRNSDPDGVLAWMEDKIAAVTGIPVGHGEPFNVLRYEFGQHYDSHHDGFLVEDFGQMPSQRIATFLTYLEAPEEGGETVFLLEGKDGLERLKTINYKACDMGIKVQPRKGDAVLFYSAHVDGTEDKHALHGSCPVVRGEKWSMAKWLRNKCHGQTEC